MGLCEPVTYMCMWRLWFSEIPTATKLPQWFPFLSGHLPESQIIHHSGKLHNIQLQSQSHESELKEIFISVLSSMIPPEIHSFCLPLSFSVLWGLQKQCMNKCTKTMDFLQNSGFLLCYSMGFSNLDYRNVYEVFLFSFTVKRRRKEEAIRRPSSSKEQLFLTSQLV